MKSCRETAKAISGGETGGLFDRIMLRMHLMMCRHCSAFAKQLEYISGKARRLTSGKALNERELRRLEDEVIKKQNER